MEGNSACPLLHRRKDRIKHAVQIDPHILGHDPHHLDALLLEPSGASVIHGDLIGVIVPLPSTSTARRAAAQ